MSVSPDLLDFIKHSESSGVPMLTATPDPATGGEPWTYGWGRAYGVQRGETCTREQADAMLLEDCHKAEGIIFDHVKVPLNIGQRGAVVSFLYNIGRGRKGVKDGLIELRNGNPSTMLRKLNAGDYAGAADEFPKWANPPLAGLVIRRARERNIFLGRPWRAIPDNDVKAALAANQVPA